MIYSTFTFDVERDWHSKVAPYKNIDRKPKESIFSEEYSFDYNKTALPRLLDLLKEIKVPGIFFITREVADNEGWLMKKILKDGHEIGCHIHPYSHQDVTGKFKLIDRKRDYLAAYPKEKQKQMILDCKKSIEKYVDTNVFRAGRMSVNQDTIEILDSLNFKIDSSVPKSNTKFLPLRYLQNNFIRFKPFLSGNLIRVPHYVDPLSLEYSNVKFRVKTLKVLDALNSPLLCTFFTHTSILGDTEIDTEVLWNNLENFFSMTKQTMTYVRMKDVLDKSHSVFGLPIPE